MKIIDIVKPSIYSYYVTTELGRWPTQLEQAYFDKHKKLYKIDVISYQNSWLMNNIDKDVVVSYYKDKFFTFMLLKSNGKNKYKVFRYANKQLTGDSNSFNYFSFTLINNKHFYNVILPELVNEIVVVDKAEHDTFIKLMLLNKLNEVE